LQRLAAFLQYFAKEDTCAVPGFVVLLTETEIRGGFGTLCGNGEKIRYSGYKRPKAQTGLSIEFIDRRLMRIMPRTGV
jgi:hypothetical protein